MKNTISIIIAIIREILTASFITCNAQSYEPNWATLDKRPIPQWFPMPGLVFSFIGEYIRFWPGHR